jgi:hypothetical protein
MNTISGIESTSIPGKTVTQSSGATGIVESYPPLVVTVLSGKFTNADFTILVGSGSGVTTTPF